MVDGIVNELIRASLYAQFHHSAADLMDAINSGQPYIIPLDNFLKEDFEAKINEQIDPADGDALNDRFNWLLLHGKGDPLCEAARLSMAVYGSVQFERSAEQLEKESLQRAEVTHNFMERSKCVVSDEGHFFKDGVCIYCHTEEEDDSDEDCTP